MIPIPEWAPDQPDLENAGATEALNVLPGLRSHRPFRTLQSTGAAASSVRIQGSVSLRALDGSVKNFSGDEKKLYLFGGTTHSDVSRTSDTYATPSEGMWRFGQLDDIAIAVNGANEPQAFTMSSSSVFDDLGGSPPSGARYIAVVGDVVVLGRYSSASNGLAWCAPGAVTTWASGGADEQIMYDGGQLRGIVGGQYLTVLQERAITLGTRTQYPLTFTFDKISLDKGCFAEWSIASHEAMIFFVSHDGIYMLQGAQIVPIGAEKVDRFFFNDLDQNYLYRVTGAVDPVNKLYILSYPGSGNMTGTPNKALIYNWQIQRWTRAEFECDFVSSAMTQSAWHTDNIDTLLTNTDANPDVSGDSSQFTGSGRILLSAFSDDHKLAFFDGENMAATVTTGEAQLSPGYRSFVSGVRVLADGGAPTCTLGTRNKPTDSVTWSSPVSQNDNAICPFRSEARFHRAKIQMPAGEEWSNIQGIEPEYRKAGYR